MRDILTASLFITIGLALGLGSAIFALGIVGETTSKGIWHSFDHINPLESTPYSRGYYLQKYRFPIPTPALVEFSATTDDQGQSLEKNCNYRLTGTPLLARWWALSSLSNKGTHLQNDGSLTSDEVVYLANGAIEVTASATPQPGNWLRIKAHQEFTIGFIALGVNHLLNVPVPPKLSIQKLECANND